MGERRVLVIGSQCRALNHLSFLPTVAEELYTVLTAPELGGGVPALPDKGLLLDPTVTETREAVKASFKRASDEEATLLLVYIGHGGYSRGNDFFLLSLDAPAQPTSDEAIHFVQLIRDLYGKYSNLDGLVVLLDTCHSGLVAIDAPPPPLVRSVSVGISLCLAGCHERSDRRRRLFHPHAG